MSKRNPSPMSLPIARLRALGFTVTTTVRHNPTNGALRPYLSYSVKAPDGTRTLVEGMGSDYASVVARLDRIANRAETARTPFYLLDRVAGKVMRRNDHGRWVWCESTDEATRFETEDAAWSAAVKAGGDVIVRCHCG